MTPSDREKWLAARCLGVGGSDAGVLMACSPHSNIVQLWAQKTGRLPSTPSNTRMRWGTRLEGAILDEYEHVTGLAVVPQSEVVPDRVADVAGVPMLRHPDLGIMLGNLDGCVVDRDRGPGVIDAKTVESRMFGGWLSDGRPPLYILVQLAHYMEIAGLQWATIAAFTGLSDDLYIFDMERDAGFGERLMEIEDTFWNRYVKRDQQPPADTSATTARTLRALYPKDNGTLVKMTGPAVDWAADFDDLTREINEKKIERDKAKTMIIATIGEHTAGVLPDGSGFTYKAGKKNRSLLRAGAKTLDKLGKATT